jgi:hypothetical protein
MIVKLQERRYKELKAKERVVNEIKKEHITRDQVNFVLSHILIVGGVVVTIVTKLF